MSVATWLAVLTGGIGFYLVIRPTLKGFPQLKAFYEQADTVWQKIWAVCYQSATVLATYITAAVGFVTSQLDNIAKIVGDGQFQALIKQTIGDNPQIVGWVMMAVSAIMFASRMRSIIGKGG